MTRKNVLISILNGLAIRPEYYESSIILWIDDDEYYYVEDTLGIPLATPEVIKLVIGDLNKNDIDIPDFALCLNLMNNHFEGEMLQFFNNFFDDANTVHVDYTDDNENEYSILSYLCGNVAPSFTIDKLENVFDFLELFIGLHRNNRTQINILSSFFKNSIENYPMEKNDKSELFGELIQYQEKGMKFLNDLNL